MNSTYARRRKPSTASAVSTTQTPPSSAPPMTPVDAAYFRKLRIAGFNEHAFRRYARCGCNRYTLNNVLLLWFFVMACASFALVFVQFAANLYIPVFVPGASYSLAYAFGLYIFGGLCRENMALVSLAGCIAFLGFFVEIFELNYAGLPPFDRLFQNGAGGVSQQFDGRVFVAPLPASASQSASVFTLFWVLWIFEIVFCVVLFSTTLSTLIISTTCGYKDSGHLFRFNYEDAGEDGELPYHVRFATSFTWYSDLAPVWMKRWRTWSGLCAFIGVLVNIGVGINEIRSRNASIGVTASTPGAHSYTWSRSPSPQFVLLFALGGDLVDLVPLPVVVTEEYNPVTKQYRIADKGYSSKSRTRFMGGRSDWYLVLLFVHIFGLVQSLFWMGSDYGSRMLPFAETYQKEYVAAVGTAPAWSNCLAQTSCYNIMNPVYDGDATYILNKTTVASPQSFASQVWNQNFLELWLLMCGLFATVALSIEYFFGRLTHMWNDGIHANTASANATPTNPWWRMKKTECLVQAETLSSVSHFERDVNA